MTCTNDLPLRLQRIDAARNMWRFYHLALHSTLFGEHAVVRSWGRIGAAGLCKTMTFADLNAARRAFKRIEAAKRRRGYVDAKRHGAI